MKISLNWVNTYLDQPVTLDEAVEALTRVGFPAESWEKVAVSSGEDWQVDVEVTSNRPDCLCHIGVARELAAATGRGHRLPGLRLKGVEALAAKVASRPIEKLAKDLAVVRNEARDACGVYTARVIRGVKVGPSPRWLVDHLAAAGQKSVNNVVDITNYVLLEMGQPLHAFDMARLRDRTIVVRHAAEGEAFKAIDGTAHTLRSHMLVIADSQVPVAVAGVMGGLDSEVGEQTTDVLLESAMFDPLSVRRTSRALKLRSESSYRFERGIDPLGVERASVRAAALIVELAGGTLAPGVLRVGADEPGTAQVSMRTARCRDLIGLDLGSEQQTQLLDRLGLAPVFDPSDATITCTIPTYRLDLQREVDLIEEVARLHGLDALRVDDRLSLEVRPRQPHLAARQALSRVMVSHGYLEAVTFSFLGEKLGRAFVPAGKEGVLIEDERRKAEPMLRPSVLPSLLSCRKSNQDVGNADVRLFETASAWWREGQSIVETQMLSLICDAAKPQDSLRDVRGTIEELVQQLGGMAVQITAAQRGVCEVAAEVRCGDAVLGWFGLLGGAAQKLFDLQTQVVVAELELPKLLALYPPTRQVSTLARFPAIERDLSVIVGEQVVWDDIAKQVSEASPSLLEDVQFITTYRGKPIPRGQKSVSLRLHFRDPGRTLRHEEVNPQVDQIVGRLRETLKAELRT